MVIDRAYKVYGNNAVMFRFGTVLLECVVSFIALRSTTDT